MRRVSYPKSGRPSDLTTVWTELVLLLQASIETANVERWALQRGEKAPPPISGVLRSEAYEVTIVDNFQRLARRFIERHGYTSLWERPLPTGKRGRPHAIDVSLFREEDLTEVRIELGIYTKDKLEGDATKLIKLMGTAVPPGYTVATNLLLLWGIRQKRNQDNYVKAWTKTFSDHAESISGSFFQVEPMFASTVDLFHEAEKDGRYAVVGLFKATPSSPGPSGATASTASSAASSAPAQLSDGAPSVT